jgi:hypothetical protein
MNDSIEEAIQQAIWGELAGKFHTAIPGKVSKYDPSGPSVEVQPVVKKVMYNKETLSFPTIVSVPVVFPRTNKFHLSFPIEKDDMVLLLFAERSIEEFLQTGIESTPQNTRKFSITDAIAIPGLFGFKKGSQIVSGNKMELVFKDTSFVSDGSKVEITTNSTIELNGNSDKMVKEGPLNSYLTDLYTALNTWVPVPTDGGAALKTALTAFLAAASSYITAMGSTKNKLG